MIRPAKARGACLLGALLCLAAPFADAANVDCSIDAPPLVQFDNYDPLATNEDETISTSVQIVCTTNKNNPEITSVYISVNAGSGSYAQRTMLGPGNFPLQYNLYLEGGYINILGNGFNGTSRKHLFGPASKFSPLQVVHIIYGRILRGQDAPIGNYTDSLIYTLDF